MNKQILQTISAVCVLACALPLVATQANVDLLKKEFATVRTLELPARTASVVAAANATDRATVAEDAIRAAVGVQPASTPMIVGAVARANADMAAISAGTATSLEPKQVSRVTKSAVGAAPTKVQDIVTAVTRAHPAAFYVIGMSAVDLTPQSAEAIANGISAATPALKALIERANPTHVAIKNRTALVNLLARVSSLVATISTAQTADALLAGELTAQATAKLPTSMAPLAAGPPTGPPYVPGGPTPGEPLVPGVDTFPSTNRNYSSP